LKLLADEEELDREPAPQPPESPSPPAPLWWLAAVVALAALPRLFYLFVVSDPENPGIGRYDDVWHHWQIAYLTKEIGLTAPDGPRLWDLKGLDYFWGVLHPLVMVAIFTVSGSIDIVLLRLVSLTFGVVTVVLLFDICRRHWGMGPAVAATLFAALLPTSVMNDASGMLEPMGVALVLLGIWAWSSGRGFWSGLAFGLATMVRAEAWLFSLGLVIAAQLGRINARARPGLWLGFGGVLIAYVWLLWAKTGNPIYPLWWNFFANALGAWGTPITSEQTVVRPLLGVILIGGLVGLALSLKLRPNGYMLLTFGFGYCVFSAGMLGFTSFLSTWLWWTPISRRFEFPFVFVGVLLAVGLIYLLPRRFGIGVRAIGWTATVGLVVASQLLWLPIDRAFGPTEADWKAVVADSVELGSWYQQAPYRGYALAVPPDRPDVTYGLARFGGVEGKHLVSEMYDPIAYLPAGYRYEDHSATVSTLVQCWLTRNDIRMIAVQTGDSIRGLLVTQNQAWFTRLGSMEAVHWLVEGAAPPPVSNADCAAAKAAVPS
jgi:hypothetical protein